MLFYSVRHQPNCIQQSIQILAGLQKRGVLTGESDLYFLVIML